MSRSPGTPDRRRSRPRVAPIAAPEVAVGPAPGAALGRSAACRTCPSPGLTRRRDRAPARRPDRGVGRRPVRAPGRRGERGVDPRRRDARVQRGARRPRSPPLEHELAADPAAGLHRAAGARVPARDAARDPVHRSRTTRRRSPPTRPARPRSASARVVDRRSPLESWLDLLFGEPVEPDGPADRPPPVRATDARTALPAPTRGPYAGVDARRPESSRRRRVMAPLRAARGGGGRASRMITIPIEDWVFAVCRPRRRRPAADHRRVRRHPRRAARRLRLRHRRHLDHADPARVHRDVRRRRPVRDPGARPPRRPGGDRRRRARASAARRSPAACSAS